MRTIEAHLGLTVFLGDIRNDVYHQFIDHGTPGKGFYPRIKR